MIDTPYSLEIAIRADEKAKSAHERLDRMNGSIDRLANQVAATNGKIDSLLAREQGEQIARRGFISSYRFWLILVAGLVGTAGTFAYLAFGH